MDLEVRIERLPRMWVAAVNSFGVAPEAEAWRLMREWALPNGLWADADRHPIFGFNNPPPSPESPEYGYELWIRVNWPDDDSGDVVFFEFEGGLYAVAGCKLREIAATWRALWDWARQGSYRWRESQELEKVVNRDAPEDELVFELFLPVEAARSRVFSSGANS